jgi:hypothetical protein
MGFDSPKKQRESCVRKMRRFPRSSRRLDVSNFTERAALTTLCCVFLLTAACGAEEDPQAFDTNDSAVMSVADVAPGAADRPTVEGERLRTDGASDRVEKAADANFEQLGAYRSEAPALPRVGNYAFQQMAMAGHDGVHTYRADAPGDTWIGTLKLDSANEYVLDARHVVDGRFERTIQFKGMYRVAGGFIDFADDRGRFLFRMSYSLHRVTDTLYLSHDDNMGQAEEGEIVSIVARHI